MKKFIVMLVLVLFVVVACAPAIQPIDNDTNQLTVFVPLATPVAVGGDFNKTLYKYVDKENGNVCYFITHSSESTLFCLKGDN
jgi:hypothetical protein